MKNLVPVSLFAGFTAGAAIATYWFALETGLLLKDKAPITWYMRNKLSWHPLQTTLIAAGVASAATAAIVHFAADEEHNP